MGSCASSPEAVPTAVLPTTTINETVLSPLATFCRTVPKAELHVHVEGTLEPELILKLAERNGVTVPFQSVSEAVAARNFTSLADFLQLYYAGCDVLQTKHDFKELMATYLHRAAADGVKYTEVFFDPQTHLVRGITWDDLLSGLSEAMTEAEQQHNISSRLIMCFLRDHGPESAKETLESFLKVRSDVVIGVGLDSNELSSEPSAWKEVYEDAFAAGFRLCAHAGEEGPASFVREVISILKVDRVDHGVHVVDDDALIQELVDSQMPLTVCPISNVRLKVFDGVYEDKLRHLLQSGMCVTINSDDPAYFRGLKDQSVGSYIGDCYEYVATVGGLDADGIAELAKRSFRASFLPDDQKEIRIAEVEAALTGFQQATRT